MANIFKALAIIGVMLVTNSVSAVSPETIKKLEEESKVNYFAAIPRELRIMILTKLISGASEDEIIAEIKKDRLISKDFKNMIDTNLANGKLIEYIALKFKEYNPQQAAQFKQFRNRTLSIARKLGGIPAAQDWIRHKQNTLAAEDQLFGNIRQGNLTQAEQIIRNENNVNIFDEEGVTPLIWAVSNTEDINTREQYKQFIYFLLNQGADVNLTGTAAINTPLGTAMEIADPTIIQMLLKAGANPNSRDWFKSTPLIRITHMLRNKAINQQQVITSTRLLLEGGTQPNLKDNSGFTALDIAVHSKAPQEIINLLQHYGAKRGSELQ